MPYVNIKEAQQSELGQRKEDEDWADYDENIQGSSIGHLSQNIVTVILVIMFSQTGTQHKKPPKNVQKRPNFKVGFEIIQPPLMIESRA